MGAHALSDCLIGRKRSPVQPFFMKGSCSPPIARKRATVRGSSNNGGNESPGGALLENGLATSADVRKGMPDADERPRYAVGPARDGYLPPGLAYRPVRTFNGCENSADAAIGSALYRLVRTIGAVMAGPSVGWIRR